MKIITKEDYKKLSKEAAETIKQAILRKPDLVLGLATGSTPVGCYEELVKMHQNGEIDFSEVKVFNLDEYLGLPSENLCSYDYFMRKHLINKINIKEENFHIPQGDTKDPERSAKEYEEKIEKAGGIDLQLLGIGRNGHIGFNEPGTSFDSKTHMVGLKESTIKDNSRFFENPEDVPRYAITMGIRTILEAKKIILLASGESKADICAQFIKEPVNLSVPASALKNHEDVIVLLDKEAGSKL